jgi:hypothetical protein
VKGVQCMRNVPKAASSWLKQVRTMWVPLRVPVAWRSEQCARLPGIDNGSLAHAPARLGMLAHIGDQVAGGMGSTALMASLVSGRLFIRAAASTALEQCATACMQHLFFADAVPDGGCGRLGCGSHRWFRHGVQRRFHCT